MVIKLEYSMPLYFNINSKYAEFNPYEIEAVELIMKISFILIMDLKHGLLEFKMHIVIQNIWDNMDILKTGIEWYIMLFGILQGRQGTITLFYNQPLQKLQIYSMTCHKIGLGG